MEYGKRFKGVVRSKFARGYVEVDGLGEILLFTRSKSHKKLTEKQRENLCKFLMI